MKLDTLEPQFVEAIPETLEPGRLYVSIRFRTSSHLCPCGCGSKVVTPIKPAKWHLTYDGQGVTLWPSVGNWQKPCQSHYWIRDNKVVWAKPWSKHEIEAGRKRDSRDLRRHYADRASEPEIEDDAPSVGRFRRMRQRFKRR